MNEHVRIDLPNRERVGSFTADEFARMVECGAFEDMRVELVGGEIERLAPTYRRHAMRHAQRVKLLSAVFAGRYDILIDVMVRLADHEVRAADITVAVPGGESGMLDPTEVHLAVEISDSSLWRDIGPKRTSYADAAFPHYWVVDEEARIVRIFGRPEAGAYQQKGTVRFGEPLPVPGTDETIVID